MFRPSQHLARRKGTSRNSESGLALLDVLLGMAIFALIAVIAVQANGLIRQRAYMSQTAADAKNVSLLLSARIAHGTALPTASTVSGRTFPDWDGAASVASPTDLSGIEKAVITAGTSVSRYGVYGASSPYDGFYICMVHRNGATIDAYSGYHSPSGKIVQSGTGAPPASGANVCDGAT